MRPEPDAEPTASRYDLQFPFVALNNSYSIGDLEDVFGVSGAGNLFKPGTLTGSPPTFRQLSEGERPIRWTGTTSRRASAWRGRRAPSGGFLRTLTGETGDFVGARRLQPCRTRASDWPTSPAQVGEQSRRLAQRVPLSWRSATSARCRCCCATAAVSVPAISRRRPSYPYTRRRHRRHHDLQPRPARAARAIPGRRACTRALGQHMAFEVRYVGARSDGNWRDTTTTTS